MEIIARKAPWYVKQFRILQHITMAWSVRLYVCMYVCRLSYSCTLLKPLDGMRSHLAGTPMWSQVTLLDRAPGPLWEGEIWESEPPSPLHSDAAYCQITLALVFSTFSGIWFSRSDIKWFDVSNRMTTRRVVECRHDMRPSVQLPSISDVDSKLRLKMG